MTNLKRYRFCSLWDHFDSFEVFSAHCINDFAIVHTVKDFKLSFDFDTFEIYFERNHFFNLIFQTCVRFYNKLTGFGNPLTAEYFCLSVWIGFWVFPQQCLLIWASKLEWHKAHLMLCATSFCPFVCLGKAWNEKSCWTIYCLLFCYFTIMNTRHWFTKLTPLCTIARCARSPLKTKEYTKLTLRAITWTYPALCATRNLVQDGLWIITTRKSIRTPPLTHLTSSIRITSLTSSCFWHLLFIFYEIDNWRQIWQTAVREQFFIHEQ